MKRIQTVLGVLVLAGVLGGCSPSPSPLAAIPRLDKSGLGPIAAAQLADAAADLQSNPEDADLSGRLAMICQAYDMLAEAAALYQRAGQLDSDRFEWSYLHATVLAALGRHGEAIARLQHALELRPGYPAARLRLAQLFSASGDSLAADQAFVEVLERNPAFARAHLAYGQFLMQNRDPQAAAGKLLTALALSNRYGDAHRLLTRLYRRLGDYDKVALHSRLHVRYEGFAPPDNDPVLARVAALNLQQDRSIDHAAALLAVGRADESASLLRKHLKTNPDSIRAHINLIAAYAGTGETGRAEAHVAAAQAIDPDSPELLDNIAVLRMRQGQLTEARQALERAIRIDPDYPSAHRNLGQMFESRGRLAEAITAYRRAVGLDPFDNQSRYLLARALVDKQLAEEAVEMAAPLTRQPHPQLASYLMVFGQALEKTGNYSEARSAYRRAVVAARAAGLAELVTDASDRLAGIGTRSEQ
ncbi:MAG: tetratricopeptide repeat protein [Gammaproteobacteria bacterium]|nr:tetratricopeptide repeat protein [Gammaproteobacteria bacterium]NNF61336.1 tetratricopeptide repeat protein [Gammaproteobacteria bacterium]